MENFSEWINGIKESNKLVIVEGKNDKIALEKLGIHNVHDLNYALYKETEIIAKKAKEVIILTDLDKEGRKLYGRLKKDLCKKGVSVDRKYREFLFGRNIAHIEGLFTYLSKNDDSVVTLPLGHKVIK